MKVQLTQKWLRNRAGDILELTGSMANKLIGKGVAVAIGKPIATPEPTIVPAVVVLNPESAPEPEPKKTKKKTKKWDTDTFVNEDDYKDCPEDL